MQVNHYPVQPGLFAGEYPGHQRTEVAVARLRLLIDKGVRTFIDLTAEVDPLVPYDPLFPELDPDGALRLARHSFEIPDMGIPADPAVMRQALDILRGEIDAGRGCYVHCWGGIGRTGTTVGCWLRECGLDGDAALYAVQRLYGDHMSPEKLANYPRSPQQPVQLRYVKDWPEV